MAGKDPRIAHLPLRSRRTYEGDGAVDRKDSVLCPARGRSLDVDTCIECHYCAGPPGADDRALMCLHPAARRPSRAPRPVRIPSPAELTGLVDVMTRDVACVRADLSLESLSTLLLERNISAAPVVDAFGRPVGVVSKTDLVRWYHDRADTEEVTTGNGPDQIEPGLSTRASPRTTVADVMMPMAFTLTEDAPVAYAAALMAVEGVHHLPVVDSGGVVVGIVSALDIVRWLAHSDGFIVPAAR